jgi:hypothetical protein
MAWNRLSHTLIGSEVDRVFDNVFGQPGDICVNPITGGQFIYGYYSLEQEKHAAYRRLLAREFFASNGPPDAPLMPVDDWERDRAKHLHGLIGFIAAQFAWSMEDQDDLRVHPSFADFASGMLWLHNNHDRKVGCYSLSYFSSEQIAQLKKRFPPQKLEGLSSFRWRAPKPRDQAEEKRRAA